MYLSSILLGGVNFFEDDDKKTLIEPYKPSFHAKPRFKYYSNSRVNNYGISIFPLLKKFMPKVWRESNVNPDLENNNRGKIGWYLDGADFFLIKGNLKPNKYKFALPSYSTKEFKELISDKKSISRTNKKYILKPSHLYVGSGTYITITDSVKDLTDITKRPLYYGRNRIDPINDWTIQPLLTNVKLWNGRKFDCRFYAVIFREKEGKIDFRTYRYGFARIAVHPYNLEDPTSLITNIAVQEKIPGFSYLVNTRLIYDDLGVINTIISDLVSNTDFVIDESKIAQILICGIDVIFSSDGTPYLIEVNQSPAMEIDTPNLAIKKYCFKYLTYGIFGGIIPALLSGKKIPSMKGWD